MHAVFDQIPWALGELKNCLQSNMLEWIWNTTRNTARAKIWSFFDGEKMTGFFWEIEIFFKIRLSQAVFNSREATAAIIGDIECFFNSLSLSMILTTWLLGIEFLNDFSASSTLQLKFVYVLSFLLFFNCAIYLTHKNDFWTHLWNSKFFMTFTS